jgi:hypothetical protein
VAEIILDLGANQTNFYAGRSFFKKVQDTESVEINIDPYFFCGPPRT